MEDMVHSVLILQRLMYRKCYDSLQGRLVEMGALLMDGIIIQSFHSPSMNILLLAMVLYQLLGI